MAWGCTTDLSYLRGVEQTQLGRHRPSNGDADRAYLGMATEFNHNIVQAYWIQC
jgi:hypothetical protein